MNNIIKLNKKYSYNNLVNDLYFLNYIYKELIIKNIGKTNLNRKIFVIKIGNGNKKILIKTTEKANESILASCMLSFIEELMQKNTKKELYKGYEIEKILNENTIYFIPMVNPDGVGLVLREKEILLNKKYKNIWEKYNQILELWNANIRGVDLEYNYKQIWENNSKKIFKKEFTKPNYKMFPGINYLSEIECINIEKFIKIMKIKKIITIKLFGNKKHLLNNKKIKEMLEENILELIEKEKYVENCNTNFVD